MSADAGNATKNKAPGTVRALVLAASRGPDDPLARAYGVRHKCLLEVGGEPMLKRVVRALTETPSVAGISVVIEDETAARQALGPLAEDVTFLPPSESAAASVLAALRHEDAFRPALITTGDHALLTAEMVEDFLRARMDCPEADLLVALARREDVSRAYPEVRRTWLAFGRERVTGCNLFLFATPRAVAAARFWRRVEKDRKRPWRIARAFGVWPLLRLLVFRPGVRTAFRIAGARLGIAACPVFLRQPEAAIDVDKPDDLELARRILTERQAP